MKNIEGLGVRVGEGIYPDKYRVCLEVPVSKEVWEDFCDARRDDLNVFGHVLKAHMSVALERTLEKLIAPHPPYDFYDLTERRLDVAPSFAWAELISLGKHILPPLSDDAPEEYVLAEYDGEAAKAGEELILEHFRKTAEVLRGLLHSAVLLENLQGEEEEEGHRSRCLQREVNNLLDTAARLCGHNVEVAE